MKFYVPNWDVRMSRNSVRGEESNKSQSKCTHTAALMYSRNTDFGHFLTQKSIFQKRFYMDCIDTLL